MKQVHPSRWGNRNKGSSKVRNGTKKATNWVLLSPLHERVDNFAWHSLYYSPTRWAARRRSDSVNCIICMTPRRLLLGARDGFGQCRIGQSHLVLYHYTMLKQHPIQSNVFWWAQIVLFARIRTFLWSPYVIGHTILYFHPVSFFLFFPRLISAVGDWMFTILRHMVWP